MLLMKKVTNIFICPSTEDYFMCIFVQEDVLNTYESLLTAGKE